MDGRGENHRGRKPKTQPDYGRTHRAIKNAAPTFNQVIANVREHNETHRMCNPIRARVGVHNHYRSVYITFDAHDANLLLQESTPALVQEIRDYFDRLLGVGVAERLHVDVAGLSGWVVLKDETYIAAALGQHYLGNKSMIVERFRGY